MTATELPGGLTWVKSTISMHNGSCAEVAGLDGDIVYMRNSRNPEGGFLALTAREWDALLEDVRAGEFSRKGARRSRGLPRWLRGRGG